MSESFNLYRPMPGSFKLEYERLFNEEELSSIDSIQCVKGKFSNHLRCKLKNGTCKYITLSTNHASPDMVGSTLDPSSIVLMYLKNDEDQFIVRARVQ